MRKNIWLDGMMGLVTGDALGNPVQFMSREEVRRRGTVTTMQAGGVFIHRPGPGQMTAAWRLRRWTASVRSVWLHRKISCLAL